MRGEVETVSLYFPYKNLGCESKMRGDNYVCVCVLRGGDVGSRLSQNKGSFEEFQSHLYYLLLWEF